MNFNKIVQFSPIRSGSTFIYNILKSIMPNLSIEKTHGYKFCDDVFYVITIRHPYNSIISSCLRYNIDINEKNITDQCNEYLSNGGNNLANYNLDRNNHVILYYEDFIDNIDYIYSKFEEKFNIKISNEQKEEINNNFIIEKVEIFVSQFKNFSEFDANNHLHGKHIGKYRGKTDYLTILDEKCLAILENNDVLNTILTKYYKKLL